MINHHLVKFAARLWPLSALAGPVIVASASQTPSYGPAKRAYPLPRDVGPQQLPALRLALLTEAKRAKQLRQSKLAAQCEADLRAVTHQMLDLHNRGH